jgi:diguanylate cyclase (GGDEF)-like protein
MGDYLKRILPDKLRLDRLYVRHHSFFSDLDAIFWTIAIILPQLASTNLPEGYIFAGPISRLFYRYVNWLIIDFVVSLAVAYVASVMWGMGAQYYRGAEYLVIPLTLAFLFSGFNSLIGLDRVLWSHATVDDGLRLSISSVFMTVIVWALQPTFRLFSIPPLPSDMLLFIGVFAGFGFLLTRYRLRLLSSLARRWVDWRQQTSNVGERVLLVGMGDGNKLANYLINQRTFRTAFSIVGTVDNSNPSQHGMRVGGNWLLGGIKDIPALIKRYDIGMILSTIPLHEPENEHILELAQINHTKLIFLDDLLFMTDRQMTRPQGQVDSEMWLGGRLEYRAMHDIVTNLPNRYLLRDRLQHSIAQAKRYGTPPGLIFIELRDITSINEKLGNKITDKVLKTLAKRFETCKRESDTLARFGFDKFAFLLENVPTLREVEIVIQRITAVLAEPISIKGNDFVLNARIGHCLCQRSCDAFDTPEKVDLIRCYACAMANTTEIGNEVAHHYVNLLDQ